MYSSSNLNVLSNFTDIKILIATGDSIKGSVCFAPSSSYITLKDCYWTKRCFKQVQRDQLPYANDFG